MNNDFNIINFLSIVFNANLYPMHKDKIKQIAKNIFKNEKIVEEIINEFAWADDKYWLNSLNILSVENVTRAVKNTFSKWQDSKYIYALCILYNSNEDKCLFYKNLRSLFSNKKKAILAGYIKQEISKIEQNKYVKEEYINVKLDEFIDYERLFNYFRPGAYNSCLSRLFSINRELNCISWHQIIEILPNNLLKFICNFSYHFYKNPIVYYLKQIQRNSSDAIISLAILNTILNLSRNNDIKSFRKAFNKIFDAINILPNKRKFYWYGILLSNMEYCIARNGEVPVIFEKVGKNKLIKLLSCENLHKYINYLKKGLKNSSRGCYCKYLIVFMQLSKTNKDLAIKLAKEILMDYAEKLKSSESHNLCFFTKHENDYCKSDEVAGCSIMQGKNSNMSLSTSLCESNCDLIDKNTSIKGKIRELQLLNKGQILKDKIAQVILRTIETRGKIYCSNHKFYLFLENEREVIPIIKDSIELMNLMTKWGINASENLYKYVYHELIAYSAEKAISVDIHRFAYYDKKNFVLYLYTAPKAVLKISPEKIETIENGDDGILFEEWQSYEQFELVKFDKNKNYLLDIIIKDLKIDESNPDINLRKVLEI